MQMMMRSSSAVSLVALATLLAGAEGFAGTPALRSLGASSGARQCRASPFELQMAKGFGKAQPQKQVSKLGKDRKAAADRYEAIKETGAPEFSVFFRKVGAADDEGVVMGGWYPVGSITCPSTQVVNKAIFDTEDALLQGAFRIHSKQIKREFQTKDGGKVGDWQDMKLCDLEYGWQLKDFPDEDVKVAERPREPSGVENMLGGFMKNMNNVVNWVPNKD